VTEEATATEEPTEQPTPEATEEATPEPTEEPAATPEFDGPLTQFNLPNRTLRTDAEWAAFHPGESDLLYNCASCHTTGYVPDGNQHGLPGLTGTWAEDGVGCESCHGPGSNHVNDPYLQPMVVNRDAAACRNCHLQGDAAALEPVNGFLPNHEQYADLFIGKKLVMDCVDCHNPHQTTKYAKSFGATVTCESCHFQQEQYQKISDRKHAACIDCHMPRLIEVAVGNPARHTADMRTHSMAINPAALTTVAKNGQFSQPFLGIDFACKGCHSEEGRGPVLDDERLQSVATGYHDRDQAGAENEQRD
jgi:hypothetical protein